MKKKIKVFAPASIANLGCGFDIMGMALDEVGDVLEMSLDEAGEGIAITNTTSFVDHDVTTGTKYTYTIRVLSADEQSYLSGYTPGKSLTF